MDFLSSSDEATRTFAREFVGALERGSAARVISLVGELGAGKTTFTQSVARALGVTEHVTSPTFVIMKMYVLKGGVFDRLIHVDAYRLYSGEELIKLGWREIAADSANLILIEWGDRVQDILPKDAIELSFFHVDERTRHIVCRHRGKNTLLGHPMSK